MIGTDFGTTGEMKNSLEYIQPVKRELSAVVTRPEHDCSSASYRSVPSEMHTRRFFLDIDKSEIERITSVRQLH